MWQLLVTPITSILDTVLKRVLPEEKMSEAERLRLQSEITLELAKQDWEGLKGQLEINKAEAGHRSLFVAGWRPGIGWICGIAFGWHFVLLPITVFALTASGYALPAELPKFEMDQLMTVLLGMLGLGGLRTFEKYKNVTNR